MNNSNYYTEKLKEYTKVPKDLQGILCFLRAALRNSQMKFQ